MSNSYSSHPICQCCKNCHELADQSSDMQRQATKVAARANSAYAQIAQLDLQGIFNQLHRMKDILSVRTNTNTNTMMSVH